MYRVELFIVINLFIKQIISHIFAYYKYAYGYVNIRNLN